MRLEEARKICEEIIQKHGHYCDYHEERREGEIKFVNLTLRLKIDPPTLEKLRRAGSPGGVQSQIPQGKKKILDKK
jgi:hypothetical protein